MPVTAFFGSCPKHTCEQIPNLANVKGLSRPQAWIVCCPPNRWKAWSTVPTSCEVRSLCRRVQSWEIGQDRAIPENREFKKWEIQFFPSKTCIVHSFDIFVVTYRVTNFLPKLVNMPLFIKVASGFVSTHRSKSVKGPCKFSLAN